MADGPFLLVLKASNPEHFRNYDRRFPTHKIKISWGYDDREDNQWMITPDSNLAEYELNFTLPKVLGDFVFKTRQHVQNALYVKGEYLSSITIYTHNERADEIYRLEYSNRHL